MSPAQLAYAVSFVGDRVQEFPIWTIVAAYVAMFGSILTSIRMCGCCGTKVKKEEPTSTQQSEADEQMKELPPPPPLQEEKGEEPPPIDRHTLSAATANPPPPSVRSVNPDHAKSFQLTSAHEGGPTMGSFVGKGRRQSSLDAMPSLKLTNESTASPFGNQWGQQGQRGKSMGSTTAKPGSNTAMGTAGEIGNVDNQTVQSAAGTSFGRGGGSKSTAPSTTGTSIGQVSEATVPSKRKAGGTPIKPRENSVIGRKQGAVQKKLHPRRSPLPVRPSRRNPLVQPLRRIKKPCPKDRRRLRIRKGREDRR